MTFERDVDLAVPAEEAYRAVMDPARLGEWVTVHAGFNEDPPERLEEGSQLVQRLRVTGQAFTVRWTVAEADPPWTVVWEGRGALGGSARAVYRFARVNGGTRFSYRGEVQLPGRAAGRLAGRLLARVAQRELDRSLERLKRRLEG